jgi:Core-2/I-Branching enzyme
VHAFLITAHKDPRQLDFLITQVQKYGRVYVHIDKDAAGNFTSFEPPVNVFVSTEISIRYSHFSMVRSILLLAKEALKDGATRLSLISGDALPIASEAEFKQLLASNLDICHNRSLKHQYDSQVDFHYYCRYIPSKYPRRFLPRVINYLSRKWPIKINVQKYLDPLDMKIGSMWWSVTRDTMNKSINHYESNPKFAKYFMKSKHPGETFFQTLFAHYSSNIRDEGTTYANWDVPRVPHPGDLSLEQLRNAFESQKFLFARKFETHRKDLMEEWHKLVLKKE